MVISHQMINIKIETKDDYWTVEVTTDTSVTLPQRCDTYEEVEDIVQQTMSANHPNQTKITEVTQ